VVDYLVLKGIVAARLQQAGYGKTKPVATNDTDDGRALNRRVEFTINKK
jgi:outer membrane protein OmpA-like peptidoglycan-associated protein